MRALSVGAALINGGQFCFDGPLRLAFLGAARDEEKRYENEQMLMVEQMSPVPV